MEVYILDDQLRRTEVIDRFESMIWTERYSASGDFQLSYRVMEVDTVENKDDSEGRSLLTVTGRSLEKILEDRAAVDGLLNVTTYANPSWVLTGTAGDIARYMFERIARQGTLSPGDVIPFIQPATTSLFPADTIAEPDDVLTLEVKPATLYKAIQDICTTYGLGFRLYRGLDTTKLYFDIYVGSDRTSSQNDLATVLFAPDLDNLTEVSELKSSAQYKNVAYVVSPDGAVVVYALGEEATAGFDRRVLLVDASDIVYEDRPYTVPDQQQASIKAASALSTTLPGEQDILNKLIQKKRLSSDDSYVIGLVLNRGGLTTQQQADIKAARDVSLDYNPTEQANLNAALRQKGNEELAKNKNISAFDGQIPQFGRYKYGVDYQLGDLVEMRNEDGVTNRMRVTEQIFVSDSEGERSYPTLSVDLFITPGSWYAWDSNEVWDEVDDNEVWDTA
jgi:hypothetical protein